MDKEVWWNKDVTHQKAEKTKPPKRTGGFFVIEELKRGLLADQDRRRKVISIAPVFPIWKDQEQRKKGARTTMEKNMARALRPDNLWRWQEETSHTNTQDMQQYVKDMLRMQASMFKKQENIEERVV